MVLLKGVVETGELQAVEISTEDVLVKKGHYRVVLHVADNDPKNFGIYIIPRLLPIDFHAVPRWIQVDLITDFSIMIGSGCALPHISGSAHGFNLTAVQKPDLSQGIFLVLDNLISFGEPVEPLITKIYYKTIQQGPIGSLTKFKLSVSTTKPVNLTVEFSRHDVPQWISKLPSWVKISVK